MSIANQIRSEVVDRRTYRRPTPQGTESRDQMIYRSHHIHQSRLHSGMQPNTYITEELGELFALAKANKVSTSGRVRWLGGTDYALKRSSCLFNCSFLNVNSVFDVVDAFWLLLNGCGVGFTPQPGTLRGFSRPKYLAHTTRDNSSSFRGRETNLSHVENGRWNLSAGDSAVAWAKFVGKLFSDERRDGPEQMLHLDFSEIRGAGERLAGYGWICAGSKGLENASLKLAEILNHRAGWLLSASDIVDVMNLMGTVLSTRRSAEIALLSAHHPEASIFQKLKGPNLTEHPHRTQSNNSLVFSTKPSRSQLTELLVSNLEGYDIGFVNGEAALKRAPWFQGCNPCAEILLPNHGFCVRGDTPLITRKGVRQIKDCVDSPVEVWNGTEWSQVQPQMTRSESDLVRVTLSDGSYLDCTPDHRFSAKTRFQKEWRPVEAKDLLGSSYRLQLEPTTIEWCDGEYLESAYTLGFAVGDGCVQKSTVFVDLYGEKDQCCPVEGVRYKPYQPKGYSVNRVRVKTGLSATAVRFLKTDSAALDSCFYWDKPSILQFMAGWLDADGTVTSSGSIRLYLSDEQRVRRVQLLLTLVGVRSSCCLLHRAGTVTNKGTRKRDLWYLQIHDGRTIPCHRLDVSRGHPPRMKGKYQTVRSVTPLSGREPVYCFTEPHYHKALFGNVYTHQCNLSEINLPAFNGNLAALEDAAHRLGRANYRQTCVDLRDGVLQPTWHQTNETLRLCGVGITGITMCPWLTPYILRRIRQAAWAGACSVANEYGTPRPAAVTTVKPSGTLSKVFGVSSGCHQPVSRYELNTILFDRHDPLVASLRGAGFQMFEHPTQENGMLIEFPIDNGSEVVENEPAIVQLERYRMLMDNWCDYNVSITVSYDHHEIPAIVDWLDRNWDSFVAVSWMQRIDPWTDPASINQRYLPQRALTPAEFSAKAKDIRPINWNQITETDVQYDIEDAAECAGGACPVR